MTERIVHRYVEGDVEITVVEYDGYPTPGITVSLPGLTVTITRQTFGVDDDVRVEESALTVWIDTEEEPSADVLHVRLNDFDLHN